MVIITKGALAMAAAAEMVIDTKVAVVILTEVVSEEMTTTETDPTIGAKIGTKIEIGAKLTAPNVKIPR